MRRALDTLYVASAGLAALALLAIFVVMMTQVALREMNIPFPGADDISACLCVATTFFALAHTFKRGELIRVGLGIERLGPAARRVAEIIALAMAALLIAYATWWTAQDAWMAWEYDDLAQGSLAFPLWVPKLAMPLGAGILLIAILDELAGVLRGQIPGYVRAAEERAAAGDFSAEV